MARGRRETSSPSDIDLTLFGDRLISGELGAIAEELDDLLLPYQIDLSLFHQLDRAKNLF